MKYTFIKLFIGLVLFGTLVGMRVFDIIDADIKNLCIGGLMGLGIMHLGGQSNEVVSTNKEGGYISQNMICALFVSGMLMFLSLTACTVTTTVRDAQVAYTQSCAAYGGAFDIALALRKSGKLNPSQIDQVTLIDSQITPLCTGPLPTDIDTATARVTSAVTALTILETVK